MTCPRPTDFERNDIACDSKRSASRTAYFRYVQWALLVAEGSIALIDEGHLCTKDNKGQCAQRSRQRQCPNWDEAKNSE
jgi:hypothetical protein